MNKQVLSTIFAMAAMFFLNVSGNACDVNGIALTASTNVSVLQSPGYPDGYRNNQLCKWVITAEKPYQVVRIEVADMQVQSTAGCQSDYVQIQDGSGVGALVLKKCCKRVCHTGFQLTTDLRDSLITFKTDTSVTDAGFEIRYWAVTKMGEDISAVKLSLVNYLLFGLFATIVCSVVIIIACIHVTHHISSKRTKQQNDIRKYTKLLDNGISTQKHDLNISKQSFVTSEMTNKSNSNTSLSMNTTKETV